MNVQDAMQNAGCPKLQVCCHAFAVVAVPVHHAHSFDGVIESFSPFSCMYKISSLEGGRGREEIVPELLPFSCPTFLLFPALIL